MQWDERTSVIVGRLRASHGADAQKRLGAALLRRIEDPLKPQNGNGTLRINPIFVSLTVLAALAASTFLLFSLARL